MNPAINQQSINSVHKVFVELTGMPLVLTMGRIFIYEQWLLQFTEADLRIVVPYIKKGIKAGRRQPGALKFSNLIENPARFEEDLGMAKAESRRPVIDRERSSVLKSTGRPATEMPRDTAVHVSQVISKTTMDNWEAMKRQLGITPNGQ